MMKQLLFCTVVLLATVRTAAQDSFTVRAQRYIEQYNSMAIAEQRRAGIPASVTLAQGVLETEAGKSELACTANNHFGIKCKNDYQGDKFFHDDDRPKECFKMYRCAEDSYKDHSDYLKRNVRYTPLFSLSQTDYESWAVCLKKCGYATNPQYAQRLIKIIEDFKLQQYTYAAMDSAFMPGQPVAVSQDFKDPPQKMQQPKDTTTKKIVLTTFEPVKRPVPPPVLQAAPPDTIKKIPPPVAAADTTKKTVSAAVVAKGTAFEEIKKMADSAKAVVLQDVPAPVAQPLPDTPKKEQAVVASVIDTRFDSGKVITVNGLKAFYAYKGEMLLQYAVKYKIRYPHLLEINDLDDAPLPANMLIYLEKKLPTGTHAKHTVKEGETMLQIAQMEGMQLKRLQILNMMEIGDEPAIGTILELQNGAARKPSVRSVAPVNIDNMSTRTLGKSTPPDQLITINKPKPKVNDSVKRVAPQSYVETVIPAKPKVADSVKPAEVRVAQPVTAEVRVKPAAADEAVAPPVKNTMDTIAVKIDSAHDELAALKAELDKVVYTNDSGLINKATPVKPNVDKAVPVKPVKEVKKPVAEKISKYYVVKKGETLSGIANRNSTTVKKLMKWNDVDPQDIRPGQKLRVRE